MSRMKAKRARWRRMRPLLHAATAEPCLWLECIALWPELLILSGGASVFMVADDMWRGCIRHGPGANRRTWSCVPRLLFRARFPEEQLRGEL